MCEPPDASCRRGVGVDRGVALRRDAISLSSQPFDDGAIAMEWRSRMTHTTSKAASAPPGRGVREMSWNASTCARAVTGDNRASFRATPWLVVEHGNFHAFEFAFMISSTIRIFDTLKNPRLVIHKRLRKHRCVPRTSRTAITR